jgi:RNA polymerase sigma factor (sigma-70 family)
MVYGVCRLLLRDAVEAEDAAQQVFLSAYRALLAGQVPRQPSAWLGTIARNECRSRLRARRAEAPTLVREPARDELHHEVGRREEIQALCSALAGLPPQQRDAVVLREFYGLSYAEVGAALGRSGPAVESLLFRSRKRLQEQLRPVRSALGMLALPLTLRESLAQALPGFGGGASAGAAAAAAPLAAKVAAATLAVGAAGTMAGFEARHAQHHLRPHPRAKPPAAQQQTVHATTPTAPVRVSFITRAEPRASTRSDRGPGERASGRAETEHSGSGSGREGSGSGERSTAPEPEHRGGSEGGNTKSGGGAGLESGSGSGSGAGSGAESGSGSGSEHSSGGGDTPDAGATSGSVDSGEPGH